MRTQSFADWEAIIVDDGSTDATAALADEISSVDQRFRVIRQSNRGPSAARNTAIKDASGKWLLFLDADDELAPDALATMTAAVNAHPGASWFYGGWRRIVGGGEGVDHLPEPMPDPGRRIAIGCPFAIHACLVRTDAVRAVGAFDETLRTCEDWDLWRKLAAAGHTPYPVDAVIAIYLVRSASASSVTERMLADGFVVIDRAFEGESDADRHAARVGFASYLAGIAIGRGTDPTFAIAALEPGSSPEADPTLLASFLVTAVPLGAQTPLESWLTVPVSAQDALVAFLEALATHVGARRLAPRTVRRLELEIARVAAISNDSAPVFRGLVVDIDLLGGLPADLEVPAGIDRIHLRAVLKGRVRATTEMAVLDTRISGFDLADSLVEGAAWPILEACVLEPIIPQLVIGANDSAVEVRRGSVPLGQVDTSAPSERTLLNAVGWPLFVQELFDAPSSNPDAFYGSSPLAGERCVRARAAATVDVAELPTIWTPSRLIHVDVRFAGRPFDGIVVRPTLGRVTSGRIRSQILMRNGVGLARAAMKVWLSAPRVMGTRLADVLTTPPSEPATPANRDATTFGHDVHRGPVRSRLLDRTYTGVAAGLIADASEAFERPVLRPGSRDTVIIGAASAPDRSRATPTARPARTTAARRSAASFDALFADDADPWAYTTGYEQTKYEQTLELVPEGVERALELACAEGHFTVQLAERVASLTATDVSRLALGRAAERCHTHSHVSFERHDLFAEPVRGSWPLIICSEVLYYAGAKSDLARVVESIVEALEPDGVLVTAHANLVVDDSASPGFDWDEDYGSLGIQEALLATGKVALEHELVTPMYRVQRYRRGSAAGATVSVMGEASADLSTDVAKHFLPNGGVPARSGASQSRPISVPILMYHRVSPKGLDAMRRWRVTPDELEAQLDFLAEAGYETITPAQWRDAALLGAELPDQPVLLTFDDGYQDFADHAFPALHTRGMTATVMLVTGQVGQTNGWDAHREGLPLMDWQTIRLLKEKSIQFGAHTASHLPLTAVNSAQALEEIASSVADISRELGAAPAGFAYPYGDVTPAVRDLVAACGVDLAYTCIPGVATAQDDALMLPRIEVRGDAPLSAFVRELADW